MAHLPAQHLPSGAVLSITWDRGKELSTHMALSDSTGVPVYFCDAHSPWGRGSNENTNGVLRRKLAKGTDLGWVKARQAKALSRWLNTRPIPVPSWSTPQEAYARELGGLDA